MQSAHVVRRCTGHTDWLAIAELYGALAELTRSPVVEINRAVAVAECEGVAKGLEILGRVTDDPRLISYQPYWAACAHLLQRSGSIDATIRRRLGWSWTRRCGDICNSNAMR